MLIKKCLAFLLLIIVVQSQVLASAERNPPPIQPLTIALDWFMNPNHAPLFVAKEHNFFAKKNLEVKFIEPADPNDAEKMLVAKNVDIAISYQPALLLHIDQGLPVINFATLINKPLNTVISLDKTSLQELKGQKIGTGGTVIERAILQIMLQSVGLDLKDVELINVRFNIVQGLLARKLQAITGAMRNFEAIEIELTGSHPKIFYPENYGFPIYDELIFITTTDHIHDPRLKKFTIALRQGIEYLLKHPTECWVEFSKKHPELNNELNKKAWFATLPYFARNPEKIDKKRYHDLVNFMQKHRLIKTVPNSFRYIS